MKLIDADAKEPYMLDGKYAVNISKRGEWIDSVDKTYMDRPMAECSECGWYINPYWINDYNFCPNCGANRRGDNNGGYM